uniref:Uncharacterized protein n=1 Tax=Oryctolagus cuniculus TaxID=9986 RepID=V9GZX0_RABIT|nr:unknown protein [Oryctolagus cuniculus]
MSHGPRPPEPDAAGGPGAADQRTAGPPDESLSRSHVPG